MRANTQRSRRNRNAPRGPRHGGRWWWLAGGVTAVAAAALVVTLVLPRARPTAHAPQRVAAAEQPAAPSQPAQAPSSRKPTTAMTPARPTEQPAAISQAPKAQPVTVVIDSPAPGSPLFSHVGLRGRIAVAGGSVSDLDSARWDIAGTDRSGSLTWRDDGTFETDLATEGFARDLTVTVSARLKDGRGGEDSVTLRDRGKGPAVFIESPPPQQAYASSVRVWGQVRGPVEAPVPFAEVASLAWSVPGTRDRKSVV